MPLRNIRPLHIMWQQGTPLEAINYVAIGVRRILSLASVDSVIQYYLVSQRRMPYWLNLDNGALTPYYSLDWHILQARNSSDTPGNLNSTALLDSLKSDATYMGWPRYELVVMHDEIYWNANSKYKMGGIGRRGEGAVISLIDCLWLLNPPPPNTPETAEEKKEKQLRLSLTTQMLVMHELGHVFGLALGKTTPADPTGEEARATHCQNKCVMKLDADLDLCKEIEKEPFCPKCLAKLKGFFIAP